MPCESGHMAPTALECEVSRLVVLLDEVRDGTRPNPRTFGNGMDRRAYGCSSNTLVDSLTASLCAHLRKVKDPSDMAEYSLEMQMWWRDHQVADKRREEQEAKDRRKSALRAKALKKLTAEDREALGL